MFDLWDYEMKKCLSSGEQNGVSDINSTCPLDFDISFEQVVILKSFGGARGKYMKLK